MLENPIYDLSDVLNINTVAADGPRFITVHHQLRQSLHVMNWSSNYAR